MFKFLPQAYSVRQLLDVCVAALPQLPPAEKEAMTACMKKFENRAATCVWAAQDVADDFGLTDGEKCEAIARFAQEYECDDYDWATINGYAKDVLAEREDHIRVEYDPEYSGGDYKWVGKFVFIPVEDIEQCCENDPDRGDGVATAFARTTGLDPICIINYTVDEHYNQFGDRIFS